LAGRGRGRYGIEIMEERGKGRERTEEAGEGGEE
jgi:hypothetical protein